ncbi:MAG: transposase [Euryarchaeota archaeon]|nr:transposase [Euryarchaeota archaeon]
MKHRRREAPGHTRKTDQKKPALNKRQRRARRQSSKREYRRFLRTGLLMVYVALAQAVAEAPAPFSVKAKGTPGRKPTDPRDVVRFLLLRALEGWSFDKVYNTLSALPSLAEILGFTKPFEVPAPSTVGGLVGRIPVSYWEELVRRTGIVFAKGPCNTAGDATGLGTQEFARWMDARCGESRKKRKFVKLHVLIATRKEWPIFLAAKVTPGNRGDAPELPELLDRLDPQLELGNVALDPGYLTRNCVEAIAARGGRPVIEMKSNTTIDPDGPSEWKRMIRRQRRHP